MAKEKKMEQVEKEMTAEEARAFRASLYKPVVHQLTDNERREAFRVFWAQNKRKYGQTKNIEQVIWLHLKSIQMDRPEKFEEGIKNFGFKKIK